MVPTWFGLVPKVSASPADCGKIVQFMMEADRHAFQSNKPPTELPPWLLPTPPRDECRALGWLQQVVSAKKFVDTFGEERFAHCVSSCARKVPLPTQHVVIVPGPDTQYVDTNGITRPALPVPTPVLYDPLITIATHAPLYLNPDLSPRDVYLVLPDFPRSRPNLFTDQERARLPSYDVATPVLYKNFEGLLLPFPDWYVPTQIELHELPNSLLQKWTQAFWRKQAYYATGYKQDHLEHIRCRVCNQEVPLLDGVTKKSRHRVKADGSYKPMCRNCAYKQGTKSVGQPETVDPATKCEPDPEVIQTSEVFSV